MNETPSISSRAAGTNPSAMGDAHAVATCRVTQVSTNDLIGGAARAARRLHQALGEAGVRSRMLVAQRFGLDPDTVEYNPFAPAPPAVGRMFFRLGRRWHRPSMRRAGAYFSPEWTLTGWRLRSQLPACDVVNLHWVTDLLDYRTLPALTAHRPVVWTFHDMNAFTGGCHYSGSCIRYADHCGACPQLASSRGENDMTRRVLLRKRRILQRVAPSRLVAVCPSAWLAREARCSALFRDFSVRVIPNGIDPQEFRPMDQAQARAELDLPVDARIVLFVAEAISDRRKGLRQLLCAIDLVRDVSGLRLVTIGRGDFAALRDPMLRHLGSLSDSGALRAAYSAGKPAFGVGPGNVPTYIEKTADVAKAVRDILTGKCFDNGTLCSSEQSIVCDEAVSALDVSVKAQIVNLLSSLQKKLNMSLLFISHDLAIVEHLTHRVAVMYLGVIVEIGDRELIFSRPKHPYTRALISSVPVATPGGKSNRIVLTGDVPSPINPPAGCRFHTRCPVVFDRCKVEEPKLRSVGSNRRMVACHLEGVSENQ